jgi:multiple sugar transport system substrate-binding protein
MRRIAASVFFLAVLCSVAFSSGQVPVEETAKIQIMGGAVHMPAPGTDELLADTKAIVERLVPNVEVEFLLATPGQTLEDKYNLLWAAGTPPDVFDGTLRPRMYFDGQIIDLSPYWDNDPEVQSWEFWAGPEKLSTMIVDGNTIRWGFPGSTSGQSFWINRDIMEKSGVPYRDDPPWTVAEFRENLKKMTADTNGDGKTDQYGMAFIRGIDIILNFVWNLVPGAMLFEVDDNGYAVKYALDKPESIAALQLYADLINKDKTVVFVDGAPSQGLGFATGQYGTHPFWWWLPPEGQEYAFEVDIMPFPAVEGVVPQGIIHSAVAGNIITKSEHKDQAWEVLKALRSEEAQQRRFEYSGNMPSRRIPSIEAQWFERATELGINIDVYTKAMQQGASPYRPPWLQLMFEWDRIYTILQQELDPLYLGLKSAEEVVTGRLKNVVEERLEAELEQRAKFGL